MNLNFARSLMRLQPFRRPTRVVQVGPLGIGGEHPIRIQSMITADTRDTAACVKEILELAQVGCEIVRVTAQTKVYAANLEHIVAGVRAQGCTVPIVADIHFKPDAALEAAKWVEKIRINPGNYADKKKFEVREYSDEQYAAELERIAVEFVPLVRRCKELGRAMRIGTNHGSLSDRIMNRFGDTPLGMVESALEFARIARAEGYHNFVFSMKASNPKVMIQAYRLLVARLEEEGPDWNYPIHLGVTEAGDGEDGRVKSAIGIGSLLADGIGDTIRVSLTEDSIHEIPVAYALAKLAAPRPEPGMTSELELEPAPFDPVCYERRPTQRITMQGVALGGSEPPRIVVSQEAWNVLVDRAVELGEERPEIICEKAPILAVDPRDAKALRALADREISQERYLLTVADGLGLSPIYAFRLLAARAPRHVPILLKDTLEAEAQAGNDELDDMLRSAQVIGSLLCDGIGDAVLVRRTRAPGQALRLAYNILQATGCRIVKADYVACPSCGRTLFNLQETTRRIRDATSHLKGVRIAVMGCIVNGPGEMADADFGYVGGAPGKVNLYVGKTPVRFNIPEAEAVERLIDLIREHGRWAEAQEGASSTCA